MRPEPIPLRGDGTGVGPSPSARAVRAAAPSHGSAAWRSGSDSRRGSRCRPLHGGSPSSQPCLWSRLSLLAAVRYCPHPAPRTFMLVSEPTGWPNGSSFLVSVLVPPRLNFQEQLSKSARLDIQSGARRQAPFRLGSPNLYDRLPWISLSLSFGAGAPRKLVILPTAQSFST